jgi:ATP-dependent DNA helicase DinG
VHARLAPSVHAAREKGAAVFDLLEAFIKSASEPCVRLTDDFADDPIWRAGLDATLTDLLAEIDLLHEGLRLVRERMEGSGRLEESVAPLLNEMRAVGKRLQAAGDALSAALKPPPGSEPTIRWMELKGKERSASVTAVPLHLAPILREDLFKRLTTTIVTSATLATDGPAGRGRLDDVGAGRREERERRRFDFLISRLGLDDRDLTPTTAVLPSPFDYPRQAILAIPSDVPAPNVNPAGHSAQVVRMALDLAEATDGGIFVLFTSHREVRLAATELRARGAERRWPLLVHGEDGRDALLRRFRDCGRAVLLGTASFWEGVDVPGRALRGLLIAKLPFRVPTEPVTAAHCEAIEAAGGDSFREYMLPHAALRLKQGFGRLVRTATDRGVILLADPRVVHKSYGRGLLDALPPARRLVAPWAVVREEVRRFYADVAAW